MNLVYLLSRKW